MEAEFRSALSGALERFGLDALPPEQLEQLIRHYRMLGEWNKRVNLTRIIEPSEAARLHYAESILAGRYAGSARAILDIGSGAGFPAVPMAVTRPEAQVTALEPNHKKATFLKEAKDVLGLQNFNVIATRVEDYDWSRYDLVTCRALDEAERVYESILGTLQSGQKLLLLCSRELVARLVRQGGSGRSHEETHPVPESKTRVVAVFSRK